MYKKKNQSILDTTLTKWNTEKASEKNPISFYDKNVQPKNRKKSSSIWQRTFTKTLHLALY